MSSSALVPAIVNASLFLGSGALLSISVKRAFFAACEAAPLGGLAVLAHGRGRPGPCLLALACSGVACGSKFSTVVPGVALAALALWMLCTGGSAHRLRTAGAGAFAALAMGGSWYLRNAVTYGNPLPPAHLAIGSFESGRSPRRAPPTPSRSPGTSYAGAPLATSGRAWAGASARCSHWSSSLCCLGWRAACGPAAFGAA